MRKMHYIKMALFLSLIGNISIILIQCEPNGIMDPCPCPCIENDEVEELLSDPQSEEEYEIVTEDDED